MRRRLLEAARQTDCPASSSGLEEANLDVRASLFAYSILIYFENQLSQNVSQEVLSDEKNVWR